nr:hypothetical protein [Tanacetum cinerariifolium]
MIKVLRNDEITNNSQKDYMGKYKTLKAYVALLTKKIDVVSKNKSEKGLVAESFDCNEESLSSKDERVTRVKAFMAIADDELTIGKADARYGAVGGNHHEKDEDFSNEGLICYVSPFTSSIKVRRSCSVYESAFLSGRQKTLSKLKDQSSLATTSRKALKIPKPFIPCKYYGFNNHHFDECEYYPGCDICGSIAHEPADYDKRPPPITRNQGLLISDLMKPLKSGFTKETNMFQISEQDYLKRYV